MSDGHFLGSNQVRPVSRLVWITTVNIHTTDLLHTTYNLGDQAAGVRRAERAAGMRQKSNTHTVLLGNPQGERSYGRSTRRWEDDIKMDLEET